MTQTLKITRGLPASGKSTWAKEQELNQPNTVRVNRDNLRHELYNKYVGLNKAQEKEVTKEQQKRVRQHLTNGKSVIVDDTNLNGTTVQTWRNIAEEYNGQVQYHIQDFPTDVEECIRRDNQRKQQGKRATGEQVIRMFSDKTMRGTSKLPRLPKAITNPIPVPPAFEDRPNAIVVDVDGTICNVSGVRHHVRSDANGKRNFHAFHMDSLFSPPNHEVARMMKQAKESGLKVIIVTARELSYRDLTEQWLKVNDIDYDDIYTRGFKDQRPDYDVKKDLHAKFSKFYNVVHAIDDNENVLRLWAELGIRTTVVPGFDDPVNEPGVITEYKIDNPIDGGKCLRCGRPIAMGKVLGPDCEKMY